MTEPDAAPPVSSKKPRQGRSPAFPFITLKKALERVDAFRKAEGGRPKHFAPIKSACAAWGLGLKTGPAIQTVAALGHYGLLEFEGSGDTRSARPTDLALRILLDSQPVSAERDDLTQKAALTPSIHKELWDKWAADLPSDPTLETYLVRDRGFSDNGARDLMAEYKATIAFAKLGKPVNLAAEDDEDSQIDPPLVETKVDDLVQVEIGGSFQLEKAARVRAVQDHDGKKWVFVDGSQTGIPMEQVVVQGKASAPPPGAGAPPMLPEDTISRRPSEREWLRGPLSKGTGYRILVSGDLGIGELSKLIKLLEAQKAVLSDADYVPDSWHFIEFEGEFADVELSQLASALNKRFVAMGMPAGCDARRLERSDGKQTVFLSPQASELAVRLPAYEQKMHSCFFPDGIESRPAFKVMKIFQ